MPNLWNGRNWEDTSGQIDRAVHDRQYRMVIGLNVVENLDLIEGALLLAQGRGRYLRLKHAITDEIAINLSLTNQLKQIRDSATASWSEIAPLVSDLAGLQANLVANLNRQAGKYVDRVLAVSVLDPGFWTEDFDHRPIYHPMCDPSQLAELSGISVVDAFPERDLAIGGTGGPLQALPYWILFADRNAKTATHHKAVIEIKDQIHAFCLPPSDGLDADIPEIKKIQSPGLRPLIRCVKDFGVDNEPNWQDWFTHGRLVSQWSQRWDSILRQHDFRTDEFEIQIIRSMSALISSGLQFKELTRTWIDWICTLLWRSLEKILLDQLVLSADSVFTPILLSQLQHLTRTQSLEIVSAEQGNDCPALHSHVAGILGFFHIDQMPANLPEMTGADSLRILGRLTPGRPASWRKLVQIMADYHPAPMRLRDAI
ncbi:MAG: anhydro-N-acetylmuramic acid kinase [Planctomycetota bacterium]